MAILSVMFGLIVIGYAFTRRVAIIDAVVPDPTPTVTQTADTHSLRAKLHMRDKEFAEAITQFETAISIDPTNPEYYVDLIDLLVKTDDPEAALEWVDKVLLLDENNDEIWQVKAAAHVANGDRLNAIGAPLDDAFGLAIDAGQAAVQLNPSNAEAYAIMAGAYVRQGSDFYFQANEMAQTAFSIDETNDTVLYYNAEALTYQGYYETARDYLERITSKASNNSDVAVDVFVDLSLIEFFYSGNRREAIRLIRDTALELEPDNAEAYDTLAMYFMLAGEYPQAEENARQAVCHNPNLVRAHARLGHAYFKQFNYPKAIEELERAIYGYELGNGSPTKYLPGCDSAESIINFSGYQTPNEDTAFYFAILGLAYYYQAEEFEAREACERAIPLFDASLEVALPDSAGDVNAVDGLELCRQTQLSSP